MQMYLIDFITRTTDFCLFENKSIFASQTLSKKANKDRADGLFEFYNTELSDQNKFALHISFLA